MLPRHEQLKYVLGGPDTFAPRPLPAFAPQVRAFLARLSEQLLADVEAKAWPDVVSFAWWCRRANVERLAATYDDGALRMGRGVAYHVTPSNVPVNFAFSWVFSMVAGNANLVRVPERAFPQVDLIVSHVRRTLAEGPFCELAAMNVFFVSGRTEELTAAFSALADVRIVWGADDTVQIVRRAPLPPRGIDVSFADRYSFAVLGADPVAALAPEALGRLATGFYNDTYLMDQNACSSPRLVVWHGGKDGVARAQGRFWQAVEVEVSKRYELQPLSAVDKLTQACRDAIELGDEVGLARSGNDVYRLQLPGLLSGIEKRRGNCGYFYEYATEQLEDIAPIVNEKYQTVTYAGVEPGKLSELVSQHRLRGIDRIVPVGSALDIGLLWDGYDLLRTLARLCHVV